MIPGLGLGRIVVYVSADGAEYAAIISSIVDRVSGVVNLHVLINDEERPVDLCRSVAMNEATEKPVPHSWHWPPRV